MEKLVRGAVDPESNERYPDGIRLIPTDAPDASSLIAHAITERRPIALVFSDGSDVVVRPPQASGPALFLALVALWLADRFGPKRDRPTFLPREWVGYGVPRGSYGAEACVRSLKPDR